MVASRADGALSVYYQHSARIACARPAALPIPKCGHGRAAGVAAALVAVSMARRGAPLRWRLGRQACVRQQPGPDVDLWKFARGGLERRAGDGYNVVGAGDAPDLFLPRVSDRIFGRAPRG